MPEIGKIHIDFQVLKTHDPKVLLLADTSDWKHIIDTTSVIEITMPGGTIARNLYWDKQKINIFNSSILGITPKACKQEDLRDLPDGIYKILLKGSPDSFNKERYYLRTERLQLEVDKYYVSLGMDYKDEGCTKRDKVYKIDFMIAAAEAATRMTDLSRAGKYYQEAQRLLENLSKCK